MNGLTPPPLPHTEAIDMFAVMAAQDAAWQIDRA